MKESGKRINRMEKAKKVIPMVPPMRGTINKVKKVVKAYSNGLMVVHMKGNLKIII